MNKSARCNVMALRKLLNDYCIMHYTCSAPYDSSMELLPLKMLIADDSSADIYLFDDGFVMI
jgi:hypothetical protein